MFRMTLPFDPVEAICIGDPAASGEVVPPLTGMV
jgi:hypothetical protein